MVPVNTIVSLDQGRLGAEPGRLFKDHWLALLLRRLHAAAAADAKVAEPPTPAPARSLGPKPV